MDRILEQLPTWWRTVEPGYHQRYDEFQDRAVRFLETLPARRDRYQLTEAVLTELKEHPLPAPVLKTLDQMKPTQAHNKPEFLQLLNENIGNLSAEQHGALICYHAEVWRSDIREYSKRHCMPDFQLAKASGIYLFFRTVFDLPSAYPRSETRTFGGWLHPSMDDPDAPFDLSWPISVIPQDRTIVVQRFCGYLGRGYHAIGEYDYLVNRFPFREASVLKNATLVGAAS